MDCFAALAMTADTASPSRGAMRPKFCKKTLPSKSEGAGKTGCALHPRSRVQCATRNAHTSIQVQRRTPGLPHAMALRLIRFRPGDRLSCHHRPLEALASLELDASTGASDPNDFTVRKGRARQSQPRVHRISPHGRDDRDRPSCCRETGGVRLLICPTVQRKYFCAKVWTDFW